MKKTILSLLAAAVICTAQPTGASASTASFKSEIKSQAARVIGTPYVMGGTSTRGFDCSGFTRYVYKKMHKTLPRTARQQAHVGMPVYKGNLSIGDLVFFNTLGYGISHVGIYIGNNHFIHAGSSTGVTISSLSDSYFAKRYVTARRVVK
ncbi:C40 family peptidase [Paenibacillus campi]|uniref:C40 family peptidase n=1 Tax=Paenibacillus campi TaxID=3106031 RepID=UPI002AFFE7D2|nr:MULTISPECIES: C40 family peptidase [unclassified Paenibacillus]